jgi:hypothetical protein
LVARRARITPNHLALIRSFLIDSGRLRPPHAAICAKLFRRADALAGNNIDAKHNARCAKKSPPKHMCGEIPSLQKPLFYRTFLNFFDACAFARHVLFDHAINFNFDRANE